MGDAASTVGIAGYGEVGEAIAARLHDAGLETIVTNRSPTDLRSRLDADGPRVAASLEELATDSELVLSCVWPDTAESVARQMAPGLDGTIYVDLNSIGPQSTRAIDRTVTDADGTFLKGVIVASVAVHGADAPITLAGPDVEAHAEVLSDAGLVVDPFGTDVEQPSALKMCRSMVTKGIMALFVETLLTARCYDLEEAVLDSVHESFADMTPAEFARYFLVDMADNSRRRRDELCEVVETAEDAHVRAPMTEHALRIHEAIADRPLDIEEYSEMLDELAAELEVASLSAE